MGAYQAVRTNATNTATTSTSFVAIDTTNLRITATPRSTFAICILTGYAQSTTATHYYWRVNAGAGTSYGQILIDTNFTGLRNLPCTVLSVITGLTAGTSYNFDWEHRTSGNSAQLNGDNATDYSPKMVVIC